MWCRNLLVSASMVLLLTTSPLSATAADISVGKHDLYLSGQIKSGDAERIASLIAAEQLIGSVVVNSSGGDLLEAMRIAELVKGMHAKVRVSKGGFCVSACFFVFLDGYERSAFWASEDGTLPPPVKRERFIGLVGIHRPYLKSPGTDLAATRKQEEIMRSVRDNLVSKRVPQHLVDEMMGRPSNDIYWLREHDLELIGEFNPAIEEALIAKCGYKRFNQTFNENWSQEKRNEMNQCNFDYWEEHFFPLQRQYLAKLRTGWRPWSGR